jgi:hypothetical protein
MVLKQRTTSTFTSKKIFGSYFSSNQTFEKVKTIAIRVKLIHLIVISNSQQISRRSQTLQILKGEAKEDQRTMLQ